MDPERPLLPDRSDDDTDRGWGDDQPPDTDAHEEWLRRQRPPHHEG
jgi:hypothetical protein